VEDISSEEFYIVKPKATCHITKQASINARALVRYPVKQAALLARDESLRIKFENKRRDVISLNQPQGMSAKMQPFWAACLTV